MTLHNKEGLNEAVKLQQKRPGRSVKTDTRALANLDR